MGGNCNPVWLTHNVFNPVDVEMVLAGHFPASRVRAAEKAAAIQALTMQGVSSEDIAVRLGVSSRHVVRLRDMPVHEPARVTFDLSDRRVKSLTALMGVAQTIAADMRDDVESVWWRLLEQPAQRLRELVMLLAAMVPTDQSPSELLAWITEEIA